MLKNNGGHVSTICSDSFLPGCICAVRDQRFDSFGFIHAIYLPCPVAQDELVLLRFVPATVDKLHAQLRASFSHPVEIRYGDAGNLLIKPPQVFVELSLTHFGDSLLQVSPQLAIEAVQISLYITGSRGV